MKLSDLNPIKSPVVESAMSDLHLEKTEALEAAIMDELDCDQDMAEKIVGYLIDNEDSAEVDDFLMDKFMDDMPYGTQKARDGDPHNWIANHMEHLFSKYTKGL